MNRAACGYDGSRISTFSSLNAWSEIGEWYAWVSIPNRGMNLAILCLVIDVIIGCTNTQGGRCCDDAGNNLNLPKDVVKESRSVTAQTEQPVIRADVLPLKDEAVVIDVSGKLLLASRHYPRRKTLAKGDPIRAGDLIEMTKNSAATLGIADEQFRLTDKEGTWFKFEEK